MTISSAQADVLELCARVRAIVADSWGYDAVLAADMLPDPSREKDFGDHASDFAGALVSRGPDVVALAADLRQVAFALIDAGLVVRAGPRSVSVSLSERPEVSATFFALVTDNAGALTSPTTEVLPAALINEVYWAHFYAHHTYASGSTFQSLVQSWGELPDVVVDVGCGDGRDTCAFAAAGYRKVTGLDRSHVAIREARRRAEHSSRHQAPRFEVCDAGDPVRLRAALREARDGTAPMVVYLRFFLHSVTADVQDVLLDAVADCSRPGDCVAAEFRTEKDAVNYKVHGNHYRRFQNGPAFGRMLRDVHGFLPLLEQEGTGFSPYGSEDPHLYRVIARRN
jgi:SAM-dependent methyltransferase